MGEEMLLVALGCGRLPEILDIAAKHPVVVFGTMEAEALTGFISHNVGDTASPLKVYFYEIG